MRPWLVTGAAGFIGFHVIRRLLAEGEMVVGIDNLNRQTDSKIKRDRLEAVPASPAYRFHTLDICDRDGLAELFKRYDPEIVINLAAQAGVRGSLDRPELYIDSNVTGFMNLLEECRSSQVTHLVYASSSSVYGNSPSVPFRVSDPADRPVSVYAATKRANELLAHSHSHVYGLPCTGLRFFTVYGPWGRPDMAYFKFAKAIWEGLPFAVYGDGSALRDFTYIDDVVEAIARVSRLPPSSTEKAEPPWRLFNVGQGDQAEIDDLISLLEQQLGRKAIRQRRPAQPGDVVQTQADISELSGYVGYRPRVELQEGLARFVEWFKDYAGRSGTS